MYIFTHILQVGILNDNLMVLLNGNDVTSTVQNVNDTNSNVSSIIIERIEENSVVTVFQNEVSITVSLSLGLLSFVSSFPEQFQQMTVGLLGNFNGDSSDDLVYPNNTVLIANATDRMIHDFGQSCKLQEGRGQFE